MTEDLGGAMRVLAGLEAGGTGLEGSVAEGIDLPGAADAPPAPTAEWPAAALDLLEEAEARARAGDWSGFGEALAELRALLERLEAGR
jgi:hypothetical protein